MNGSDGITGGAAGSEHRPHPQSSHDDEPMPSLADCLSDITDPPPKPARATKSAPKPGKRKPRKLDSFDNFAVSMSHRELFFARMKQEDKLHLFDARVAEKLDQGENREVAIQKTCIEFGRRSKTE